MSEIKTTYADIPITYDEKRNLWTFELRGRARTAESLEKAKDSIDAPVKETTKAFARFKAWHKDSWEGWQPLEVTSIGEKSRYGGNHQVWTVRGKDRSLKSAQSVYPVNEHNDPLVAKWMELDKQVKALETQKRKIQDSMKFYEVPKEEEA